MSERVEVDHLIRPDRVHRHLYTDPAVFEAEMQQVFGATWCYLAHESQVAGVGDFVTTTIGRRSVIVTRDGDGAIHALLNRCAHRGATVTVEDRGCSKRFTCPYHGWTYGADGALVGLPFPGNHPGQRGELGLGRLAVAMHRGFVFGCLHPDPAPFEDWLGHAGPWLDAHIDRYPGAALRVLPTPVRLEYAGNWKLSWDNAADGLHATFAHRSYNVMGRAADTASVLARDPASTEMIARALGAGHMVVDQRPGIPDGPWASMRPMPFAESLVGSLDRREQLDLATGNMVNLSLFPNLLLVGNQLMVVEPISTDRTRLTLFLVLAAEAPDEVNLLRLRVDEDFMSFGTPDDLEMFERVQDGLRIPEMEWVDVSRGLDSPLDATDERGVISGPITSEAPQRGYLAEYARLMRTEVPSRGG